LKLGARNRAGFLASGERVNPLFAHLFTENTRNTGISISPSLPTANRRKPFVDPVAFTLAAGAYPLIRRRGFGAPVLLIPDLPRLSFCGPAYLLLHSERRDCGQR